MKRMMRKLGLICEPHTAGMTNMEKAAQMIAEVTEGQKQLPYDKMLTAEQSIELNNEQIRRHQREHLGMSDMEIEQEQELSDMGFSQSEIEYIREKYNK